MRKTTRKSLLTATLFCAALTAGLWPLIGPWWAALAAVNVVAFFCYGLDKRRARRKTWRIPESLLLLLATVGGAAGSILGQQTFRHKTKKRSFRLAFWSILLLQTAALGAWLATRG